MEMKMGQKGRGTLTTTFGAAVLVKKPRLGSGRLAGVPWENIAVHTQSLTNSEKTKKPCVTWRDF